MLLSPGTRLAQYEILEPIGKGGMGEVYRARDAKLGRQVAIKILSPELARDDNRLARFQTEAKLLAALNHPHIATIYDLDDAADTRFIVMELVEGASLDDRLRGGPLDVEQALELARQIAEALDVAHEKGVIHRDLKPANIQITPDGQVKVLDFGLAKELVPHGADPILSNAPTLGKGVTQEGIILGTAPYMAPEQARGMPVDKRADIWAFGCVLFEMLSGQVAFLGADVAETLAKAIRGDADWSALPASIPAKLRALLRRCLEKDPKKRYRDIGDVLVELEKTPHEDPLADTSRARPSRLLAGVATLLTGALLGVATWVWLSDPIPLPVTRFSVALLSGDNLTFDTAAGSVAALSPDSSQLVYVANDQLYLRPMDQARANPVEGTEGGRDPFFSPDGQSIGFWAGGEMRRVPLGGGVHRGFATQWTPSAPAGVPMTRLSFLMFKTSTESPPPVASRKS